MIEFLIKFFISIFIVFTIFFSSSFLLRLWNTQIDVSRSMKSWLGAQLSLSNWIAVRDKNLIYQNGRPIGLVEISPVIEGNKITFPRVRYISMYQEEQNLEYRRYTCNKIDVKGTYQVQGFETIGWYENLECQIIND